ncbi:MAG: cytochrome c biogenesis heme-transporting ATPase CcmA [Pseudomonadota bacterium]
MTLQAYQLAYARGDRQLFSDINFEIKAGEALWLKGVNGSGKTSLLRLLCGLASPASGEVRWGGFGINTLREDFYRDLIYCGHASIVKDDLAAWENVSISARLSGKQCSRNDAYDALDKVDLIDVAHLPARALSQGQRKRVALARFCIQPGPKLSILDEPFTALDQTAVDALHDSLNQHLNQGGIVVYTTHQELALQAGRLHHLELSPAIPC